MIVLLTIRRYEIIIYMMILRNKGGNCFGYFRGSQTAKDQDDI